VQHWAKMSKNRLTLVYSILLLSVLFLPTFAVAQEEPTAITTHSLQGDNQQTYIIPWSVLDAGGTVEEAISANYRLKDAMGQPVIGKCENANYRLYVGFLAAPEYVEKAIDVEPVTIGSGTHCFSFAIFADPQIVDNTPDHLNKVQEAIGEIQSSYPDVKFVIALGDLIQGEQATEADYRTEFGAIRDKLEALETQLSIPYIPIIGNHDVWFDYYNYQAAADSPEKLFDEYFSPQYDQLEAELPSWTKQKGMPIDNPYDDSIPEDFPDIYFQNFAFSYGPYRFICIDFCARDDFKNAASGNFGYADLHDKDPSNNDITEGTWDWLKGELDSTANSGVKNIVFIVHHPPDGIPDVGYSQNKQMEH
jgi:hypothetical protein